MVTTAIRLNKSLYGAELTHWEGPLGVPKRIRNRSMELVECERLAALHTVAGCDLSSGRYVFVDKPLPIGKPLNDGTRRSVPRVAFKPKLAVVIEAKPLSLLCDRCSLKLIGFSSCISDDGTHRVRRCYVCRAKCKVPVYRKEVTKTTPRRRSKTNWGDSPAPRTQKLPVNALPNHSLRKPIRRKLWFRKCEVIPPFMSQEGLVKSNRRVTERGPEEWVLRTLCKDVQYSNVGVWRDSDADQGIPFEVKRRVFRSRRGATGIDRLTNSQAALIATSGMNPINLVNRLGLRGRRSRPRDHWMTKRRIRFTLYSLKVSKWQLQEDHLRKLRAARLEVVYRRKMRKLRIESRHALQSNGYIPNSDLDIRGVYVSGAVPVEHTDGQKTWIEWEFTPAPSSFDANPYALLEDL